MGECEHQTFISTKVLSFNCTFCLQKLHLSQMPDSHFLSSSDSPEIGFHSCIMCVANPQQSSFISIRSTVLILNNLTVLLHPPGHTIQPLIDPSLQSLSRKTTYSMLSVSSSSFSSFSLEESLPFFSSNTLEHLHIRNTHFSNISLSPSAVLQNEKHAASCSASTMLAELSMFECVENALYGSLFESICRKGGFAFLNCSFHKCNRQRELITERVDTSIANVSLFSDVDFILASSYQGPGGAIHHTADSSLNIIRCLFKDCIATESGGAIVSDKAINLEITFSNFSFCQSWRYGGCCIISDESSLIIQKCSFENSSDVMGGGAINHHTSNENDIIDQCLFQNCRCNGTYQGGGGIDIGGQCKTIIKNCVFSNLVSAILGGGITIHTHPSHESTCQLLFCLFRNNTSESDEGHDIHVASNVTLLFNETSLETCRTFTNKERRVVVADVECDGWLRRMNYPIYVSRGSGSGEGMCGWTERKCKTIAIALEMPLWGIGAEDEPIVQLESESLSECPFVVERIKVLVKGVSNELTIISKDITASPLPLQQPLISVAGGELRWTTSSLMHDSSISSECPLAQITSSGVFVLEECIIAPGSAQSPASARFESPLILVASAGKLNLLSTKIAGFSFADAAAIPVEGGSTVCANATFSEIVRSSGSGAAIHGSLQSACTLDLDNTSLENCGCSSNDGGGIWASLGEGSSMEIGKSSLALFSQCTVPKEGPACRGGGLYVTVSGEDAKFKFQHVDFQLCDGWKGRNMFVSAPRLSTVISRDSIAFGTDSMEDDDLMGYEDGFGTEPVPLKAFLIEFGGKGFVGGEKSRDFRGCGSKEYPCCSVQYTGLLHFENTKRIIVLNSGFVWNDAVEMTGPAWDIGCTAQEKIRVGASRAANAEAMIAAKANTDITNVMFAVPGRLSPSDSSSNAVLIQGLNGTLKLSLCGIQMDQQTEAVSYGLICMKGGSLECIQFNAAGLRMSGVSLFVVENTCASARLDKLSLTNTTTTAETGLIEAKAGSSIELRNSTLAWQGGALCCHFVKMSDSGAVDASRSAVVQLANNTASNMKLERSGGCVVEGVVKCGSMLIVVGGVFENCISIDGNGGGMSVKLESGSSMQLGNAECAVELRKCEAQERDAEGSGNGGGIFIEMIGNAEDILLESALFSNCVAARGNNVFVAAADLSRLITPERVKMAVNLRDIRGLSGFERSTTNEQYAIPLVVYLWDNFSGCGFVDGEEGGDFSGCGYAVAPCRSISHLISLKFTPLPGSSSDDDEELSISVSHISSLTSSLSLSPSVESEQISMEIIGKDNESGIGVVDDQIGNEECMIHSTIHLSFEVLSFHIPTAFAHHRTFIRSSTSSSHLEMKHCSFTPQSASEPVSFILLSVSEGNLLIDNCSLSSFSTTHPFLLVSLPSQSITLSNITISNVSISLCSLVSFERTPSHLPVNPSAHNEVSDKHCCSLQIQSSSFSNNTCSGDSATILCFGLFDAMESVVEKCTFSRCTSETSERGGALMLCVKSGESLVEVKQCSFTLCQCSTVTGRGGGMMLDCVDPSSPSPAPAPDGSSFLPLKISEIRFTMNDALVGKDIFINCQSIEQQINETLFALDFIQESLQSNKSICASDADEQDVDLIPLITFLYAPQIFVSLDSTDTRQCGLPTNPCKSISSAVHHIQQGLLNAIFINTTSTILSETTMHGLSILPSTKQQAIIQLSTSIPFTGDAQSVVLFEEDCTVRSCLISFASSFQATHLAVFAEIYGSLEVSQCTFTAADPSLELHSHAMAVWGGVLKMSETSFSCLSFAKPLLLFSDESEIVLSQTTLDSLTSTADVISTGLSASVSIEKMNCSNISLSNGCLISTNKEDLNMSGNGRNNDEDKGSLRISISSFENISSNGNTNNNSVVRIENDKKCVSLINCSFSYCLLSAEKGSQLSVSDSSDVSVVSCLFDGKATDEPVSHQKNNNLGEDKRNGKNNNPLCGWNGSLVDVVKSSVLMKDIAISNSPDGGITMSGGNVIIEKGEFVNNNPSIEGYPSLRRNIICSDSGTLNVKSLKGGDGVLPNASLWMLNDGCSFEGIPGESASPFFIPDLESVSSEKLREKVNLVFRGLLLLPCNLSFETVAAEGDEEVVEKHLFDDTDFISEEEVHGSVPLETLEGVPSEAEVRVCILF
eukprot:MONOS_13257.1-p1 / transcript=MONOS_13257.1 / gene=MONOS_13257 / organism=Monocercomonoides_exilis_PA203 / gene_product=unspecified product / transcript_product=unspecified product / location=Mono_scaffold00799:3-6529(-) / protein_length=2155 / sequence_SO=supercontig / SO=protein_coding / is_pseudo=false